MPALGAGIHVFLQRRKQDVDGRDKPGHDAERSVVEALATYPRATAISSGNLSTTS
jgi:hypothetical protein